MCSAVTFIKLVVDSKPILKQCTLLAAVACLLLHCVYFIIVFVLLAPKYLHIHFLLLALVG